MLYNHNSDYILGRTTNGTAKVISDLNGLHFSANLPDTSYPRDAKAVIKRGDVRGCSFGFFTDEDMWGDGGVDENGEDCMVRRLSTRLYLSAARAVTRRTWPLQLRHAT